MSISSSKHWSRRDVIKRSGILSAAAAVAPLTASTVSSQEAETAHPSHSSNLADNLYTRIGVIPFINARGTYTIISGSQSLPEVKQAMFEASHYYVHMDEMMTAVGAEIASLMGAPSAIVTNGCESAIALATIACRVGMDPEKSQSLPYLKEHSQVIIPKKSRNVYDFGVRMTGAELIEVETEDELRAKISDQTAMIYILSDPRAFKEPLSIKTICAIAKGKSIPVFVDAAAEEPLNPNIHLQAGATFVAYSGGKCMRGPQAAGVLLGPKDLCKAAFWNAAPHHNWGRALKVGKEETMGMLAAVRQWYKRDHDAEQRQWLEWNNYIASAIKDIPSVTTNIVMPTEDLSNRASVLRIHWDASKVGITGTELVEKLDKDRPRILVEGGEGRRPDKMESSIGIMPYMMQPGDYKIVADSLSRHLRNPGHFDNPPVYPGPTAELTGAWDVTINYTRGVGHQHFVLTQNNSTITGELRGELFNTALHGKVNGDHVELSGRIAVPGDQEVLFAFTGVVTGQTLKGEVGLGEYGSATFSAIKA